VATSNGVLAPPILGHTTIPETFDRYSHVAADMQRRAARQLDAALAAGGEPGERTA
jgi:hypothetical protein